MNKPKLLKTKSNALRVKSFLQDQDSSTIAIVLECHEPTSELATYLHNLVISKKPVRVVEESADAVGGFVHDKSAKAGQVGSISSKR